MAKVSFVGFQEKVEIPEGFHRLDIEEEFSTSASKEHLFGLISNPDLISKWLYPIASFDSRPGGKIAFTDSAGNPAVATCTSFSIEREVSMVADDFGSLTSRVSSSKGESKLEITFSILTDQLDGKRDEILAICERLRALI